MSDVETTFVHETRDYVAFYRGAMLRALMPATLVFLVLIVALAFFTAADRSIGAIARDSGLLSAVGIFAVLFAFSALVRPHLYARAAMRMRGGPTTYRFDERGVLVETVQGRSRIAWEQIVKARETAAAFALYPSRIEVHVLPKRTLDAAQQDALRGMLRARGLLK